MTTVYAASRASVPARAAMWQSLRAGGWPINSTWIDESGPGQTADMRELWSRVTSEVTAATGLVLYVEASDFPLKGALVEVGMALALRKRVAVLAHDFVFDDVNFRPLGSWMNHPLVRLCATFSGAKAWALSTPHPMTFEEFCVQNNCSPQERLSLAHMLAVNRAAATMKLGKES